MGSDQEYIEPSEAARIVGCDTDRIHRLCDEGLVRRMMSGDQVKVHRGDIAELHRLNIAGEMRPGEMIRRILFLEREVQRIREAVNLLFEVNGIGSNRFMQLEDEELLQLYNQVSYALGQKAWPDQVLLQFAEAFMRLTEIEIDRLNDLLKVDSAWMPFYRLALDMSRFVVEHERFGSDLTLQRIRDLLCLGRKNLQTMAVWFIEKKSELGPSRELLAKLAANDLDMFDHLAKQLYRTNPSKKHKRVLDLIGTRKNGA